MKHFIVHLNEPLSRLITKTGNVSSARYQNRPDRKLNLIILTLVLSLCLVANPTAVLSAPPAFPNSMNNSSPASALSNDQSIRNQMALFENRNPEQDIKEHVMKFYLQPALIPDLEFAKLVLPKYVQDMNTILAKNTNRRLLFDPETGIILTDTQPHTNSASLPLPVEGFEIWAHAVLSPYPYSYDGYGGLDSSGAGVLAGLKWRKIYDPDVVTGAELQDYWVQINNMLHELAHIYKAGIGEYYKLTTIQDTTGVPPWLDIDLLNPDDSFWSDKPDFRPDPLLRNAIQDGIYDHRALLDYVKYSDLTATIMSGDYRNGMPTVDLQNITISVTNDSGEPLSDASIKIWSVIGKSPYPIELLVDAMTDVDGQVSFAWGGASNPHNNYDFLRLIKVYKEGFTASAKYVSIYDADIEKLIKNNDHYNISISLNEAIAPSITSITCGSLNPTLAKNVDFVVTFSEPVIGVDETDFVATKTGIADAIVTRIHGEGETYTVTVSSGSSGVINLEVVDDDTIIGISQISLGGVGMNDLSFSAAETCTISDANQIFLPFIHH